MLRHLIAAVVGFVLVFVGFPIGGGPAAAVSPNVVISQVYGGGGNSGAPLLNDYIELFNRGTGAASLAGWSLQYTSAAGTGNFGSATNLITPLSGTIAPGQYLLVQEAAGTGPAAPLPTPDVTDSTPINMAAGGGKVALVNTTTPLGCNGSSTPCSPTALAMILDLVGLDGANFFEGPAAGPATTNLTSAFRKSDGCQDTDNNGADFVAGTPAPRNSASPLHACPTDVAPSVASTTPPAGGGNAAVDANISITFSEMVNVTAGWYDISCASGPRTATVSGGPITFTLDPATDFVLDESCTVTVFAANVTDQDVIDPPDNMSADYVFSFSTIAPPTLIHDIQGAGHRSPLVGALVKNVPGIVTARRTNGFYLQDPNADNDPATSEGIFVFTSSAPTVTVGDGVSVRGTVQEFRPGGASSANLTTTELGGVSVTKMSGGNALPSPIVIDTDRTPPTEIIEDDASSGDVETSGVFDPATDGIDFWESLEGMLVSIPDPVATGPSNSFNEISVLANDGAGATGRSARGGIVISATDKNPEKVIVDDEVLKVLGIPFPAQINVGDHFVGSLTGVIDYNFGNFMVELTAAPTKVSGGLSREVTSPPAPNELAIATFNVENLDPNDGAAKFSTLAGLIVNSLLSPDVISLEEVQDNNGATDDGTVDATTTLTMLRDAVSAAGGPTYQWRLIDPVNDQDGGEPGGNIRQAFFFRTDRGLSFVDRPGATSTTANSVVNVGGAPQLQYSPGRIDPANSAFGTSRKPLAAEFMYEGHHLFVIANHFNSKGGDDPLWGHRQPPVLNSEVQRIQQASIEKTFVQNILAVAANTAVVVLGDLNDFEWSTPLLTLKSTPLNDLIETLPANERYTYVFEGNSQTLDHILVSNRLLAFAQTDVVHVNSEFWDQASDHEPQVARLFLPDAAGLCALTRTYIGDPGISNSLCVKLDASAAALERGLQKTHDNQLTAFVNEVNAQRGKAISDTNANTLIALAGTL